MADEVKLHPQDEQDVRRRRRMALCQFRRALVEAWDDMPAGYPGASEDRNRFMAPVEQVVASLDAELRADDTP